MRGKKLTVKRNKRTTKPNIKYLRKKIFRIVNQESEKIKRVVVLDAANIACAYTCSSFFSVKGLKIAMAYFEKMGHRIITIVPEKRLEQDQTDDYKAMQELHNAGKLTITPCEKMPNYYYCVYDDPFILESAIKFDGAVISNDNYRDLIDRSEEFKNIILSRVVGFTWFDDDFFLPPDPYGKDGPTLDDILYKST